MRPAAATQPVPPRPVRDRPTRAAYACFAMWGWFLYCLGPTVPLLRTEQGTSRAVAGLHGTALALGALTSAALTVPLVRRFNRQRVMLGSAGVVSAGVLGFVVGPSAPYTIAAVFVAGIGGSLILNAANPAMSDHHGAAGPAVISEANAVAASCGIVAPLALGVGVALGLTWRAAILVTLPLAALAVVLVLRAPRVAALVSSGPARTPARALEPASDPGAGAATSATSAGPSDRSPLSRTFWLSLALVAACVAVEFCTTFWAADLLHHSDGLNSGEASAAISALLLGMTAGRLGAAPLTLRISSGRLLMGAIALTALGWGVFWAAQSAWLAVAGLTTLGLGLALQYPLALIRLMHASDGRPDAANAWSSLAVGFASGAAPFGLGALADRVGSHDGFLLVPALLVLAAVLISAGRLPHRAASAT